MNLRNVALAVGALVLARRVMAARAPAAAGDAGGGYTPQPWEGVGFNTGIPAMPYDPLGTWTGAQPLPPLTAGSGQTYTQQQWGVSYCPTCDRTPGGFTVSL